MRNLIELEREKGVWKEKSKEQRLPGNEEEKENAEGNVSKRAEHHDSLSHGHIAEHKQIVDKRSG